MDEFKKMPEKRFPLHVRFYLAGIIVLIAGLASAALIFISTADYTGGELEYEITHSKSYEFQLERIGGKSAVMGVELTQLLGSLWHGKRLALSVAFLSIGFAMVCFWLADYFSIQSRRDNPKDRTG